MRKKIGKENVAFWEKVFNQVLSPREELIHSQTTTGILLMLCAITAMIMANSHWNGAYHDIF